MHVAAATAVLVDLQSAVEMEVAQTASRAGEHATVLESIGSRAFHTECMGNEPADLMRFPQQLVAGRIPPHWQTCSFRPAECRL